ncbi:MAG: tetratricopeptide repeat protein [Pyrinomonadaceae bacterium]
MFKRLSFRLAAISFLAPALFVHPSRAAVDPSSPLQGANDVVIVLPFENKTNLREFNWVGESFADSLAELLNMPGLGLIVVSGDEREMAYQRLRLPQTILPSRATAIKIAREARATLVVIGTYEVAPAQGEGNLPALRGTARVIRVNEGRLTGETLADGRWAWRPHDFGGALTDLQKMQGRLAYEILYERDKALPVSLNNVLAQATKVPPVAFESYVKGALTDDAEKKSAYLQNALREYTRANAGAVYPQAAFELGLLYYNQHDWKRAAEHFSMLQKKDPHYAEAAFYAASSYWRTGDLVRALGALTPLTVEMPLTGVYNNAGAISTQAARGEKAGEERERLLKQALTFLGRAAESAPDDPTVRFNYGYAQQLTGRHAEAAEQLSPVVKNNPRDGEALFLLAKSLENAGQAEAAAANDNEARKWLPSYAKMQTEWQRAQATNIPLRLRERFNRGDYVAELRERDERVKADTSGTSAQELLAKGRELYAAGRDDEALPELRRVFLIEPMNAEAHLLIGRINHRRGDLDAAISALKTAIFWDAKLIDAHILLGRIFLERGDRTMAISYARNAMQIDPNNQEAIALQRQVTTNR